MNKLSATSLLTAAALLAALSCTSEKSPELPRSSPKTLTGTTERGWYADSVLGATKGNETVITSRGDTIQSLGGALIDADGTGRYLPPVYGVEEYRYNSAHYLRVTRILGNEPNGRPIEKVKARLQLPALDGTNELAIAGQCTIGGRPDHLLMAIGVVRDDSTYARVSRAWRFDPASEKLSEIPAQNVSCARLVGDD